MRGRVLEVTTRPNAPHGATSRRIRAALGLVADETELCRWDARRRGQEDERARDRVIVQVRPRALDFFSSRKISSDAGFGLSERLQRSLATTHAAEKPPEPDGGTFSTNVTVPIIGTTIGKIWTKGLCDKLPVPNRDKLPVEGATNCPWIIH